MFSWLCIIPSVSTIYSLFSPRSLALLLCPSQYQAPCCSCAVVEETDPTIPRRKNTSTDPYNHPFHPMISPHQPLHFSPPPPVIASTATPSNTHQYLSTSPHQPIPPSKPTPQNTTRMQTKKKKKNSLLQKRLLRHLFFCLLPLPRCLSLSLWAFSFGFGFAGCIEDDDWCGGYGSDVEIALSLPPILPRGGVLGIRSRIG